MKLASVLILLWFSLAFTLSVTGWFSQFSAATLFGIGAILSATGFLTLHRLSRRFRGFLKSRSLKRLTLVQTLRFFGMLALVKTNQHILPATFAIPTGVIDVAFALTSFFVAARLVSTRGSPRRGFIAWHILGLAGLAVSVTLAILLSSNRFGFLAKEGVTIQAMAQFPMSLVPTFIGPMVLICHLLALAAVWRGTTLAQ